jgi:hypothetical protein
MARLSYNRVKSGANKNTMNIKAKEYRSSQKFKFLKYSKNISISTGGVSLLLPEYFF